MTVVLLVVVFAACSDSSSSDNNLDGVWNLQLLNGAPVVEGTAPRLDITGADASGTTGCNSFGGSVSYADGTLAFTQLAWTEIGCEPDIMNQESAMFAILTSADRYELVDELLTIRGTDGTMELTPG